jgi:hypothetical protein
MLRSLVAILFFSSAIARAQCTNMDFELMSAGSYTSSNAVTGWSISSQSYTSCTSTAWAGGSSEFSIVTTPIINEPFLGILQNSPLGGTVVAKLNDYSADSHCTRLTRTLSVTSFTNSLLQIAFACGFQSGSHSCCQQAHGEIAVRSASGSLVACIPLVVSGGSLCTSSYLTYTTDYSGNWSNWQVKYYDLFPYVGSYVVLEVTVSDCTAGDHYGSLYFDAKCLTSSWCSFCPAPQQPVIKHSMCPGSTAATLSGPLGYATYSWVTPSGYPISSSQSTLASISITNALPGNVYTVSVTSASGCTFTIVDTLQYTQISIIGIGSTSTCPNGASGSTTVVPTGSGDPYVYSWVNSSNSVVATASLAQNLGAGVYSVTVSSAPGCGTAVATVTVNVSPALFTTIIKPFCAGQPSYLGNPGTNHAWYTGSTVISSATTSTYTVTNPCNNCFIVHSFNSPQGCRDSIRYHFAQVAPGTVAVGFVKPICSGASNGTAVISMTMSNGSMPGFNSFIVTSTGTIPAYSSSVSLASYNSYSVNGLSAGVYSVYAHDGNCGYGKTFTVQTFLFDYTVSPVSATVCSGGYRPLSITFTTPPSATQYSYSWTPTSWMPGNNGSFQSTIISPTISAGTTSNIIYTVVVTPSYVTCPLTKTLSITIINPTVGIAPIPPLCQYSPAYTVQPTTPGGYYTYVGSYTGVPGISWNGVITPSISTIGLNTFNYNVTINGCGRTATGSYSVMPAPPFTVSGDQLICKGDTTLLSASGVDTYTWSTGSNAPNILIIPQISTVVSVSGGLIGYACTKTVSIPITVISPTISITGNTAICKGSAVSLTASGASSYTWAYFATGPAVSFVPSSNSTLTVIGKEPQLGCISSKTIGVKVVDKPELFVIGNTTICKGSTLSLVAGGAEECEWGMQSGCVFTATPLQTTQYLLTGTNGGFCKSTKTIVVKLDPCTSLDETPLPTFKFYPNPTNGDFFIDCNIEGQIMIFDVSGRLIVEKELLAGKNLVKLEECPAGIYGITVVSGKLSFHDKLVVLRSH